jgi:predicted transcriptional regulator YdeE
MLKIGDFSKLAQVSVKALRHYGRLGLLKPAWIDRFTGYRYYRPDQLPRLNRILALKELGFSLEQIRQLLRDDLSAAELRGMMRLKHAELERQVQAEQARLARVEARLRQIEREGALPDYEVVLKSVLPQRVIGIREVIPSFGDIGRLFGELRAYLQGQNVSLDVTSPTMAIYYDGEHRERGIDVEAAAPIARRLAGISRATVHELPAVEIMACAVHQGDYEGLPEAYGALMAWTETSGFQMVGPNRDLYLQGPSRGLEPAQYVTEVQFPVKKKPISVYITHNKESDMEPKIVTKPAFSVVGLLYHGKNENNEIPGLWEQVNPRFDEIKAKVDPPIGYGVCGSMDDQGAFDYMAGFEVTRVEGVPAGMTSWEVPEQTYAVFPCTLKTIHDAYQYAFQTWLPSSGYQQGEGPDFELYDEEFDHADPDPRLTIYIPIK